MKSLHRILPALCAADALSVSSCGRGLFDVGKRLVRAFGSPHRYARGKAALSRTRRRALPLPHDGEPDLLLPDGIPAPRPRPVTPSPPFHFGGRGKYPLTLLSASPRQTLRFLSQGLGRLSGQRRLVPPVPSVRTIRKRRIRRRKILPRGSVPRPGKASASPQPRASVNGGAVYINRRISV